MQTKSDTELSKPVPRGQFNIDSLPLDDPKVWATFHRGDTLGIFQLEKQLGMDWAKKVKPNNIEELSALVSILRPGCLESGISEEYANRKNLLKEIEYLHPSLEAILKDTFGLIIYQESIIRIGIEIAGMTEEDADLYLRKAVGKKDVKLISECEKRFIEGCKKKGVVNDDIAVALFDIIKKFGRYGFNHSHAVGYAVTSYISAYIKTHYPTEFYCSWLTYSNFKPNPREEIYNLVQDAKLHNINIIAPNITRRNIDFEIVGKNSIAFGLSHIRGIGESAIKNLLNIGNISSFKELIVKPNINKSVLESLIKSGACDCFNISRTTMVKYVYTIYGQKTDNKNDIAKPLSNKEYKYFIEYYQNSDRDIKTCLQMLLDNKICVKNRIPTIKNKIEYLNEQSLDSNRQKSIWEKLYLGLNLTCSAADDFIKHGEKVLSCRDAFFNRDDSPFDLHVVLDSIRERETSERSKNPGQPYAYLSVSDNTGALTNLVCWPEAYAIAREKLSEGIVLAIKAQKKRWKNKEQTSVLSIEVLG